jgi:tRNA threonylcarbamoyladenosine biosynthesis protein TsaB
MENVILLNIDASDTSLYMSICKNGQVLAELLDTEQKNHCANLQPFAEQLLKTAKINWADIHAIAVMNGPGSYTGLRISLAAAKGYCFALDIPLITISNLAAMAFDFFKTNNTIPNVVAAISPMQNELIIGEYSADLSLLQPEKHIKLSDTEIVKTLTNKIVIGSLSDSIVDNFCLKMYSSLHPTKQCINQLSMQYATNQWFTDIIAANPNYIKDTYIN